MQRFAPAVRRLLPLDSGSNQRNSALSKATLFCERESEGTYRGDWMKLKFTFAALLALILSLGAWAQNAPQDPQDNGGIKQDTKDAAHSTGKAAKKVGHKIKKGTKKVVHTGAKGTRKGASKVEEKTEPTPTPQPTPPPQK